MSVPSRRNVLDALAHRQPARVPMDFGATATTGIAASVVYQLRQALGLDEPGTPVKVVEPYQVLGEIAQDLRRALGIDCVGVPKSTNMFGFANDDWKPWRLTDGTPVLVPGAFNTVPEANGDLFQYPGGDHTLRPSGRMPQGGFYFDTIVRQEQLGDQEPKVEHNTEEFQPLTEAELLHLHTRAQAAHDDESAPAIVGTFADTGFGDIALVPAPFLANPRGIRDVEEWYVSTVTRPDFVKSVFTRQCDVAIENLRRAHSVLGDMIDVLFVTGTDFGTQRGPFLSVESYRSLYKPFHQRVNTWVHEHTSWRTFIHSCGGVEPLIPEFVEAGFDILNPVQCSAEGMDPVHLKRTFGDRVTFWGGGIDTQHTLPFGTPEQVREEVKHRVDVFANGGGFVFNAIHNVQAGSPIENVIAMFEAFAECR